MEAQFNDAKHHLNTETGFLCRYIRSNVEKFTLHYHNYYEVFMMLNGNAQHTVNGKKFILSKGHLLFIRDFDSHLYSKINNEDFEFLNCCFSKELLMSLFDFWGKGFPSEMLLTSKYPPTTSLSPAKQDDFFLRIYQSQHNNGRRCLNNQCKNFFTQYLYEVFSEFH